MSAKRKREEKKSIFEKQNAGVSINKNRVKKQQTAEEEKKFFKASGLEYVEFFEDDESFKTDIVEKAPKTKQPPQKATEQEEQENNEQVIKETQIEMDKIAKQLAIGAGRDESILELRFYELRQLNIQLKKERIATLCSKITENPDLNFAKYISVLYNFCSDSDITVKKLAIASQCALFKDILPGYKIFHPEATTELSKDVKVLWNFENSLLIHYQKYLQLLEAEIKGSEASDNLSSLAVLSVRCMAELLASRPFFNFRSNIVATLVPLSNSSNDEVVAACCESFIKVYHEDSKGEVVLEILRAISQMIKNKENNVRPEGLATFTRVKISDNLYEVDIYGGNKAREQELKKKKKKKKKEKDLERDLEEAEAVENKSKLLATQTEIVRAIFITYFRVLKQATDYRLLSSVLQGVAKFAHHINVEVVIDLLDYLKSYMKRGDMSLQNRLECIRAAFEALKKHDALVLEIKDFYHHLYVALGDMCSQPTRQDLCELVIRCTELMLFHRKQVAMDRVAAFAKRLASLSLCVPPNCTLGLLALVAGLVQKYPRLQQLIDDDAMSIGVHDAEIQDPDHAYAFSVKLFETLALKFHYHPVVAELATSIPAMVRQKEHNVKSFATDFNPIPLLVTNSPMDLFTDYDLSGGIRPQVQFNKAHPLRTLATKNPHKGYYVRPTNELSEFLTSANELHDQKTEVSFKPYYTEMKTFEQVKLQHRLRRLQAQLGIHDEYLKQKKPQTTKLRHPKMESNNK